MLKPLQQKDSHSLYLLFQDDDAKLFLDLPIYSFERFSKQINEWLALEILGLCVPRTIWSNGELAGIVLLTNISPDDASAEMGTWLGAPFRGKGLNWTVKCEMLNHAYLDLSIETVLLITASSNKRSLKSIEKLPFATEQNEKYKKLKREREFLFRQSFEIYEIRRDHFFSFS